MVLGNLIQLNAVGNEDRFLYGNPQMTHFKSVYKRSSNFAINYSKVPFVGNVNATFGKEVTFNIPFKADLLGSVYFKFQFKDLLRTTPFTTNDTDPSNANYTTTIVPVTTPKAQFTSYVNGIGYNCIEHIKLHINGQLVQTIDSKLMYLLNELNNSYTKKKSFYKMTAYHNEGFSIGNHNKEDVNSILVVPFFFSRDPSMALPLCALTHSDVKLVVKFKTLEQCIIRAHNADGDTMVGINGYHLTNMGADNITLVADPLTLDPPETDLRGAVPARFEKYEEDVIGDIATFEVFTENIYLDDREKKMFLNRELTYLIELYHIGNTRTITNPNHESTYTMDIEGKNPTKYIMWYLQREDVFHNNYYDNHTYEYPIKYSSAVYHANNNNHLLKNATVSLNNADVNDNVDAIFLSDVELYQKFENSSEDIIYLFSFALHPRKLEPTGTVNLSRILYKSLRLTLTNNEKFTDQGITPNILFKYYTCYYNILVIKDGLGGLMYQ
jgi:hypothetical protein